MDTTTSAEETTTTAKETTTTAKETSITTAEETTSPKEEEQQDSRFSFTEILKMEDTSAVLPRPISKL